MDEELWQKICQEIKVGTKIRIVSCTLAGYNASKLIGKKEKLCMNQNYFHL